MWHCEKTSVKSTYFWGNQSILTYTLQWSIQDFPEGGRKPRRRGANLLFSQFSRKLLENEDILGQMGDAQPSHLTLDQSMLFNGDPWEILL